MKMLVRQGKAGQKKYRAKKGLFGKKIVLEDYFFSEVLKMRLKGIFWEYGGKMVLNLEKRPI
jgi:hypothetical protein